MIYLGQTNRYVGEACWSWGGADSCHSGGGYTYAHGYVKRKYTVEEDRERLGITKRRVKKIIRKVAKTAAVNNEPNDLSLKFFIAELERRQIEAQEKYLSEFEEYRDRLIGLEIYKYLKIQEIEEEEIAIMLLM